MSLKGRVKRPAQELFERSPRGIVAWNVMRDRLVGLRARLGRHRAHGGATHERLDLARSVAYIDEVFGDYLRYSWLGPADLEGARVLEVGPGDNPGVALRFLAAGAARVVCVDRFLLWRDPAQQREILRAVIAGLEPAQRDRLEGVVTPDGELVAGSPRLEFIEGVAIEEADRRFPAESFDLIVSRAVLEHVLDVERSLAVMDRLLAPGGTMVHKVDFRDHGMFTGAGMHPLTFLTVRDGVWRWTGRNGDGLNRRRRDTYRETLSRLGYAPRILATHVAGVEAELVPHRDVLEPERDVPAEARSSAQALRPRLAPEFRGLDAEDLLIAGIFFEARKPERGP